MGAIGSKSGSSSYFPSSTVHLRGKKDLAGVGIIFRRGAEGNSKKICLFFAHYIGQLSVFEIRDKYCPLTLANL